MILSLEDVSFKYAVEPILDHVRFVVNEKDKWGVVGLNGAGKSTLLKILSKESVWAARLVALKIKQLMMAI